MASSVFIESSSMLNDPAESANGHHNLGHSVIYKENVADSNLVVVYGKNGINFDRKGLENLIEEKTLSSISVIRLTSPTPSMEDEESSRHNALIGRHELFSEDDIDNEDTSDDDLNSEDCDAEFESNEDHAGKKFNNDDDSFVKNKYSSKKNMLKYFDKARKYREPPEVVGLTVEEFYPPVEAKVLAKEILKMAGVSSLKRTADYEFQLYVIKNDHCYTPFTSPAQMKAKLAAEKLDAEKPSTVLRKYVLQPQGYIKQKLSKNIQDADTSKPLVNIKVFSDKKKNCGKSLSEEKGNNVDQYINDDKDIESSESLEEIDDTDFSSSEKSTESDNDRDSDLDFDISNRKGRKRKVPSMQFVKRNLPLKVTNKSNRIYSQDDSDNTKSASVIAPLIGRLNNDSLRVIGKTMQTTIKNATVSCSRKSQQAVSNLTTVTKKTVAFEKNLNPPTHQATPAAAIRRGPMVHMCSPRGSQLSESVGNAPFAQPLKEIVINKVIASPKGGFTDIAALLSDQDVPVDSTPSTPTSSTYKSSPSSKGFMPLGIETASKNQLPLQISVQTHQSLSELAAEHDKQLDLIDSIVKDELKKSSIIEKAQGENKNIPKIVKMLESTELSSDSTQTRRINNFNTTTLVEDVDITNAPLLETPDSEIPDDLLQHVVELIETEKTLQDAVEKHVFDVESKNTSQPPQSDEIVLLKIEKNTSELNEQPPTSSSLNQPQFKSIIESNVVANTSDVPAEIKPHSANITKIALSTRKEPIQIIRGNGRVITLPPIEAPTTRAKRRAQVQPVVNLHNSVADSKQCKPNESMDTSLQSNATHFADFPIGLSNASAPEKKSAEIFSTSRRHITKEGNAISTALKNTKKITIKKISAKIHNKIDADGNVSESQEDDDDPNKLWCICRQPHNNRFMICCDFCEDWFHGTCVSITKSMGLEMEQKGIDWTCPKCVKKVEEKNQRKITDMLETKRKSITNELNISTTDYSIQQNINLDSQTNVLDSSTHVQDPLPKKQIIDIKKIQSGKFISVKSMEHDKLPMAVLTSAQKKQFVTPDNNSTTKLAASTTNIQAKRVVVQKMSDHKTAIEKKAITLNQPEQLNIQKISVLNPNVVATSSKLKTVSVIERTTPCIVCKRPSRPNSIYCSDDCIRKHAQNALSAFSSKSPETTAISSHLKTGSDDRKKKSKGLFEDLLSMADLKPKIERVFVFERKSGRILTGSNAPTTINLKKWLQDNPTFEVVQPGSSQAIGIEKKPKQRTTDATKIPTETTHGIARAQTCFQAQKSEDNSIAQIRSCSQKMDQKKSSPTLLKSGNPKHMLKYSNQLKSDKTQKYDIKDDLKSKDNNLKRLISEKQVAETCSNDSEPIRLNVRRTLKEQLLLRINELVLDNSGETLLNEKLSSEDVEQFVKETESEMYNLFNRDTGSKYKSKYRSLMFNIKDRKNQTLFQKICAKVIKPKQLVRMSPEELASQELAQWRENETKHQLEMIKKSELDLLSCVKNYVLKTHKGEEVIEGKSSNCINLDMEIPVEDVVAVLNNSTLTCNDALNEISSQKNHNISELNSYKDSHEYNTDTNVTEDKITIVVKTKQHDHKREKRSKSKDRHKEKPRNSKRARSRSRSWSREKRSKNNHKEDKGIREERSREKERDRSSEVENKSVDKKLSPFLVQTTLVAKSTNIPKDKPKEKNNDITVKRLESFSLIDQILESSKTVEEAANLVFGKSHDHNLQATANIATTPDSNANCIVNISPHKFTENIQDTDMSQDITTSPPDPYLTYSNVKSSISIWNGTINMIDVASFQIVVQSVDDNCFNMGHVLPEELDVVGRIGPDTVWDYISKIKKSPNKEIVILSLLPASPSETAAYTILYQYLNKRNRLGVIKTTSTQIKDFYIIPLGNGKPMPTILQPTERMEFYDDLRRPDMLIGIIIRVIGKRISTITSLPSTGKTQCSSKLRDLDTFTPPGSPKLKRLQLAPVKDDINAIIKATIISKKNIEPLMPTSTILDDQDEPYSPGGSSDDDLPLLPMKSNPAEEELKRKMDEINRQIAAQEMEIAGLLSVEPTKYTSSSGSKVLNPSLANISIPSNLSQILASIKSKPDSGLIGTSQEKFTPPPPLIGAIHSAGTNKEYNKAIENMLYKDIVPPIEKSTSRLAQLSEAELLSMVPDDMIVQNSPTLLQPSAKKSRYEEPPPPGV